MKHWGCEPERVASEGYVGFTASWWIDQARQRTRTSNRADQLF